MGGKDPEWRTWVKLKRRNLLAQSPSPPLFLSLLLSLSASCLGMREPLSHIPWTVTFCLTMDPESAELRAVDLESRNLEPEYHLLLLKIVQSNILSLQPEAPTLTPTCKQNQSEYTQAYVCFHTIVDLTNYNRSRAPKLNQRTSCLGPSHGSFAGHSSNLFGESHLSCL